MTPRPDEIANQADIERDQRIRSNIGSGISTAAQIATGIGAAGISAKILPFLSAYVPADLAMKGINKISPKLGQFLKKGESMGLSLKDGLEYIKGEIGKSQESQREPPKEKRNVIEQYSPELHQFLQEHIKGGRSPLEAAALATLPKTGAKGFKSIIEKLTKDFKAPWSNIVEMAYGLGLAGKKSEANESEKNRQHALGNFNNQKKQGLAEQETERFQNQYGNQQQPQKQPGPGQIALMDILQKINQQLGQ